MNDKLITIRNGHIVALLRRRILEAAKAGKVISDRELIDYVMSARPSMHYVTYAKASRKLHLIEREGEAGLARIGCNELAIRRWMELYGQVRDIMERRGNCGFAVALSDALNFNRPSSFYVTENVVRRLLADNFCVCRCVVVDEADFGRRALIILSDRYCGRVGVMQ